MPSLDQMLQDTMLFVAAGGAGKEAELEGTSFSAPPLPTEEVSDEDAAKLAIWHWTAETNPARFSKVTCIARGMGNGRMTVCDEISFGEVIVTPQGGSQVKLPLEAKFVVRRFGLDSGRINAFDPTKPSVSGSHALYPLEANVDKSVLYALVFDFPNGPASPPEPVSSDVLSNPNFMPSPGASDKAPTAGQGDRTTVTVDNLRVVVFLSLVCCKERFDFDPGGLLGAGRMIPHAMIMANRAASSVFASVKLTRPTSMKMEGGDHSKHANMNLTIESGVYADDNDADFITLSFGQVPSPFWHQLFDAYIAPVKFGLFKMVRPDKGARVVADAIEKLSDNPVDHIPGLPGAVPYQKEDIRRVRRQGAFDNIHLAPSMRVSASFTGVLQDILDKVYMAPFCEHDCLHTHWRWGEFTRETHTRGWSQPSAGATSLVPGSPYSTVGAPMVPDNQDIRVSVVSQNSFDYQLHAKGRSADAPKEPIPSGTYTFLNHHGSGYAVSIQEVPFFAAKGFVEAGLVVNPVEEGVAIVADPDDSAPFYWHLRFALMPDGFFAKTALERLKILDASKVRDD